MEKETVDKMKRFIESHEKSIRIYHAGDDAEKVAQIVNHYEKIAAHGIGAKKQMIEDTLVYFRSVVMITESIGLAGTHAEKAARLRGLIELLQSAITKLKQEKEENLLNNWSWYSWDFSTYPYENILRKFDDLKRENESLKEALAKTNTNGNVAEQWTVSGIAKNGSRLAAVIEKELKAKHIQMKKELQKIIIVMKQKEEKAMQDVDRYEDVPHMQGIAIGKSQAFSSCIQWLILLLNSESENSGKNDADNSDKPM